MMTPNEKNELAKIYSATCKAFDKVLEPDVLKMQIEDLDDLDFQSCLMALHQYRRNPKNVFWPKASKIRELVCPELSQEGQANEAMSRVRLAIGKFGWSNPQQAKEYIGELGWKIVERSGGWQYLCENHGVDLNPLTLHAQGREIAKALLESERLGIFDKPIQIGRSSHCDPDMALNETKREEILRLVDRVKEIGAGK